MVECVQGTKGLLMEVSLRPPERALFDSLLTFRLPETNNGEKGNLFFFFFFYTAFLNKQRTSTLLAEPQ